MSHGMETYILRAVWAVLAIVAGVVLYRRYRETGDRVDRHIALHFLVWGALFYGVLSALLSQQFLAFDHPAFPVVFVLFYPFSIISLAYLWLAYNDISGADFHEWFWGYVLIAGFLIGLGVSELPTFTVRDGVAVLAYPSVFSGGAWLALLAGAFVLAGTGVASAYRHDDRDVQRRVLFVAVASLSLFAASLLPHVFDGTTAVVVGQVTKLAWFGALLVAAFPERFS